MSLGFAWATAILRKTPNSSSGFLTLPKTKSSAFAISQLYRGQAWAHIPQTLHSFTKLGFPLASSRLPKGQTTTHVPQLAHFPVSTTSVKREFSKLSFLELMTKHIELILFKF